MTLKIEADNHKLIQSFMFFLRIAFSFHSCKDNKRKEEATKIVNEWIGKEIRFPENVRFLEVPIKVFSISYV